MGPMLQPDISKKQTSLNRVELTDEFLRRVRNDNEGHKSYPLETVPSDRYEVNNWSSARTLDTTARLAAAF